MKTARGPAIFLAQFAGDNAPYNSLDFSIHLRISKTIFNPFTHRSIQKPEQPQGLAGERAELSLQV